MSCVSYVSAVGDMMYVMVCTRSKISYLVGVVSGYMKNPGKSIGHQWDECFEILEA